MYTYTVTTITRKGAISVKRERAHTRAGAMSRYISRHMTEDELAAWRLMKQ